MNYKIGLSKQEMTCFIPGIGMMGYGQHHNVVKEIATPLWARILIIKQGQDQFILAHLEQAFVTLAIKEEVLKRLSHLFPSWNMGDDNLAITAQHTHSAPGGYSHYPLYNFTIPGFQTRVFDKVVSAIIQGISEASKNLADATINFGVHDVDPSKEIAFNRSITAHALNPEAIYHSEDQKHLAVNRRMEGFFIKNSENKTLAFLNWFGVHCTSVSSFNQKIHHDNKGIAADLFEKNHPGTIAFFMQSSAGDVSPNFIWDKKTKLMRGKFSDQYESAAFNGELQFRESEKIISNKSLAPTMEYHQIWLDMAAEIAAPAHGVAFLKGTLEGPGVSEGLGKTLSLISRGIKKIRLIKNPQKHEEFYDAHGAKDIILDHRDGSFLGIPLKVWKVLPPIPEPSVDALRQTARNNALETLPWAPCVLPFQILRLGEILVAFVPGEITTIAGERLKKQLESDLEIIGIKDVVISSYANAFMGYITTPEEYDKQCYEGGHTIYGRNTLHGILKGFRLLSMKMLGKHPSELLPSGPFHFPPDELSRRNL